MPIGPWVNDNYEIQTPVSNIAAASVQYNAFIARGATPYNAYLIDLNGTVTVSGAGADAGYGINDLIDRFTLYVTPGELSDKQAKPEEFALIQGVRWFCLYQFARDLGYVPPVTQAGAGTGSPAVRSTFVLPMGDMRPTDSVRIEFTTGAFAAVGTTVTAWSVTLTFRPLLYGQGQMPDTINGAWVGYKENVLDIVASSNSSQSYCKPGPAPARWKLACAYVIRNESARGTLADGWTWFHLNIGGRMILGQQTPEIIHKVRAATKARLLQVAGIMPLWLNPIPVSSSDFAEWQNEATATTAGTSILWVYYVAR